MIALYRQSSANQITTAAKTIAVRNGMGAAATSAHCSKNLTSQSGMYAYEHPVVPPQVSHFMQVPLRSKVKLPHSPQASPS